MNHQLLATSCLSRFAGWAIVLLAVASLAARGEKLAAVDGRCIPGGSTPPRKVRAAGTPGCVAPPLNTASILGRRAFHPTTQTPRGGDPGLPAGRLARLGATPAFHHGLLGAAGRDVPLIEAIKKADAAAIGALLKQKVDVNVAETDGTTALHWAVHRDDLETATLLIRAGAKLQAANRYGVTPLSLACLNGHAALIELLVKAGANPNAPLAEGETPLLTAARTGKAAALKVLLAHGADVNAKESWRGQDSLIWAAAEGHVTAAQVLLEHGADVNSRSKDGYTPLVFAARQGHGDVVKLLLAAGANVNATTSETGVGASALIMAIYNGHWDLAAFLLEKGADANISASGYTPLHLALQIRNPDMDRNPDPEQFSEPVKTGNLDNLGVIKALLAHGANPNARMSKGFVGLLAPPDMPLVGATPFFLAAKGGDTAVMRLLLASGVDDPLVPTKTNVTPLMAAAGVGYQQGRSSGSESDALDAVSLCVELGADVNAANTMGFRALHGAAIRGANSIVQFLFEKGARLDARDKRGRTALTIAEDGAGDSQQRRQLHTAALLRALASGVPGRRQ